MIEEKIYIAILVSCITMLLIMLWQNIRLYKLNIVDPITTVLLSTLMVGMCEAVWTVNNLFFQNITMVYVMDICEWIGIVVTFSFLKRMILKEVIEVRGGRGYKAMLFTPFVSFIAATLIGTTQGTLIYVNEDATIVYGEGGLVTSTITFVCMIIDVMALLFYVHINKSKIGNYKYKIHTVGVFILIFVTVIAIQNMVSLQYSSVANAYAIALLYLNTRLNTEKMIKKVEANTKVEADFNTARKIQIGLITKDFPPFPDRQEFDLYAKLLQSKHAGGDFYDFYMLDSDHLALMVADVAGDGIPASLMFVIAKTVIRNNLKADHNLEQAIKKSNTYLADNSPDKIALGIWIGVLEISTGKLSYVNAGHEQPAVSKNGGRFVLANDEIKPVMAASRDTVYELSTVTVEPGDEILWYSDGVKNSSNEKGQSFGIDRILNAVSLGKSASVSDKLQNLILDETGFRGTDTPDDDLIAMIIRYNGVK